MIDPMADVLIGVRVVHFAAAMLLLGVASFAAFIAPTELVAPRRRLVRGMEALLVLLIALTSVAWLALEAGAAGKGWSDVLAPSTWLTVLSATDFGSAWIWHLALSAVLVAALPLPRSLRLFVLLFSDGLLLFSLGFVGHAAMQAGLLGLGHRLNHALHVLAAGFWVGSLLPLLACLVALNRAALRASATRALLRFSGLGHIAVAVTILTGLADMLLTLGHLPLDWSSPYQALFATKLALVVLMLGIALGNRYVLTPRLAAHPADARRGLIIGTIAELVLGAGVIVLVSAFATFDPG
jgi:putative copper resistance protein D